MNVKLFEAVIRRIVGGTMLGCADRAVLRALYFRGGDSAGDELLFAIPHELGCQVDSDAGAGGDVDGAVAVQSE